MEIHVAKKGLMMCLSKTTLTQIICITLKAVKRRRTNMNKLVFACAITMILIGGAACASPTQWKEFQSSNHFSVMYPAAWTSDDQGTQLGLLSSPRQPGTNGVVLGSNQGEIIAVEALGSPEKSLSEIARDYEQDADPDWQKYIVVLAEQDIASDGQALGCANIKEIVFKQPAAPLDSVPTGTRVRTLIHTGYFCEIRDRKIAVLLTNVEGDQKQSEYQAVVVHMAKSIRLNN